MGSAEDLSPSEASSAAAAHNNNNANAAATTQATSNGQLQQFRSLEEAQQHAATQQDVLHLQQGALPQQGQQHQHEAESLGEFEG